jgi:hypothetical protein
VPPGLYSLSPGEKKPYSINNGRHVGTVFSTLRRRGVS